MYLQRTSLCRLLSFSSIMLTFYQVWNVNVTWQELWRCVFVQINMQFEESKYTLFICTFLILGASTTLKSWPASWGFSHTPHLTLGLPLWNPINTFYWIFCILIYIHPSKKNVRSWFRLVRLRERKMIAVVSAEGMVTPRFPKWQSIKSLQAIFPEGDMDALGVHSTLVICYDWLAFWTDRYDLEFSHATSIVLG